MREKQCPAAAAIEIVSVSSNWKKALHSLSHFNGIYTSNLYLKSWNNVLIFLFNYLWKSVAKDERNLNEESYRTVSRIHLSRLARGNPRISWKQVHISTGVLGVRHERDTFVIFCIKMANRPEECALLLGHLYICRGGSCKCRIRGTRRKKGGTLSMNLYVFALADVLTRERRDFT